MKRRISINRLSAFDHTSSLFSGLNVQHSLTCLASSKAALTDGFTDMECVASALIEFK